MTEPYTSQQLKDTLAIAEEIALAAGQLAMQNFARRHRPEQVSWKGDDSPVTATDKAVEALLRQELRQAFPEQGLLGEEADSENAAADFCWILDPIDGTRSFTRGIPIFGIQLALAYQGRPILGLIHLPALGETVKAAEGLGCWLNGERCQVSEIDKPERAFVHIHERDLARSLAPRLGPWLDTVQIERNWGDCYSFILVATGRVEAALDPRMQVWDSAPLPVLVREAGGFFSDWEGRDSIWTGSVLTANAALAPRLLDLLQTD